MATKDFPSAPFCETSRFVAIRKRKRKEKSLFWKGDDRFPNKQWINSKWRREKNPTTHRIGWKMISLFSLLQQMHCWSIYFPFPHSFSRMFKVFFPRLINSKKGPWPLWGKGRKREGVCRSREEKIGARRSGGHEPPRHPRALCPKIHTFYPYLFFL